MKEPPQNGGFSLPGWGRANGCANVCANSYTENAPASRSIARLRAARDQWP
jgi:hypothetical protein